MGGDFVEEEGVRSFVTIAIAAIAAAAEPFEFERAEMRVVGREGMQPVVQNARTRAPVFFLAFRLLHCRFHFPFMAIFIVVFFSIPPAPELDIQFRQVVPHISARPALIAERGKGAAAESQEAREREVGDGKVCEEREGCGLEREAESEEGVERVVIGHDEVEVFEAWERREQRSSSSTNSIAGVGYRGAYRRHGDGEVLALRRGGVQG